MTVNDSSRLTEATVQDIQLELIRRTQYNAFDGERVARGLKEHRDWWEAALLVRTEPLLLITLRDLPYNDWNADTLFILARDEERARQLEQIGNDEWAADVWVFDQDETERKLGTGGLDKQRLVRMWWD